MKISEIKARIASLLDMSPNDVILNKQEGATPSFEKREDDKLYITYSDSGTLVHEFLHACFTPRNQIPDMLLNALEDHRISCKAEQYDSALAKANKDIMSDEQYELIMRSIKGDTPEANGLRAMSAIALPKGTGIDIEKVLQESLLKFGEHEKDHLIRLIKHYREKIENEPTSQRTAEAYYDLKEWITQPKSEKQGMPSTESTLQDNEDKNEEAKRNLKKKAVENEVLRLSKQETFILEKGLKKIIQNRSIGKAQNTIKGKLVHKRLGRFPSEYLFKKKTSPSPDTHLYILADFSGSMMCDKFRAVHKFINTLRETEIPHLKYEIRAFNSDYFKNWEIPLSYQDAYRACMERELEGWACAEYNDDAHWLNEILNEIERDPCDNKSLLILSDGRPAPSGIYDDTDLKKVVNKRLVKSNLPYMSIGIMDSSVKSFYPKARVADSTTELVKMLSKYSRELIKF